MNGRGIARGILVVVLLLVLVGLGVRSLVSRTVEHAQARTPVGESNAQRVTDARGTDPAPDPAPEPEPMHTATRTGPMSDPAPVPTPLHEATALDPDDPRLTPMVPGLSPLPPAATPPGYDPTAPIPHRGSLPAMVIRDVVHDTVPELRFCFEWQLGQHPELAGRVTMEFTIAEDGSVLEPTLIEDALHDETVARCFTHVISGLRFPPPDGEGSVRVRYPFLLDGAPEARRPEGI